MNKKIKIVLTILIIIIVGVGVVWLLSRSKQTMKPKETGNQPFSENKETYELTPEEIQMDMLQETPITEEEKNAQTFKISSAKGVYPKFISGYITPPKPIEKQKQKISIKIEDPSGIKKVVLEIKDEYGEKTLETLKMKLSAGDAFKGDWVATWQPHDFENVIRWVFTAENNDGKTDDLTYFTTTK